MKFPSSLLLSFVIAITICSHASAQTPQAVGDQLMKYYRVISKDFHDHNIQGIADLTAPNFVALSPNEPPVDKPHILNDLKQQMSMLRDPVWNRRILRIGLKKNIATVLVIGHLTATIVDKTGKSHAFILDALAVDQWVKSGKNWQVLHSQVMKVQALIDGKPVQH